jgi:hypothetical protein
MATRPQQRRAASSGRSSWSHWRIMPPQIPISPCGRSHTPFSSASLRGGGGGGRRPAQRRCGLVGRPVSPTGRWGAVAVEGATCWRARKRGPCRRYSPRGRRRVRPRMRLSYPDRRACTSLKGLSQPLPARKIHLSIEESRNSRRSDDALGYTCHQK